MNKLVIILFVTLFFNSYVYSNNNKIILIRSGTFENPYIEEELDSVSEVYREYLNTSNDIIDKLKNNEYQLVYYSFFSEDLKSVIPLESFVGLITNLNKEYGIIINYKPMQWSFEIDEANGVLICSKIVEHEKGKLVYIFSFGIGERKNIFSLDIVKYVQ